MKESFKRYASALALALTMTGVAQAQTRTKRDVLVPPGAVPSYMGEVYKTLIDRIITRPDRNVFGKKITLPEGRSKDSGSYRKWEHERIGKAADDLMRSEFNGLIAQWLPLSQINQGNASGQYRVRQQSMQILSDTLRSAFGLPSIPVILDVFPDALSASLGFAPPPGMTEKAVKGQLLIVNYVEDPNTAVQYGVHEIAHTIDYSNVERLLRGQIDENDPLYSHVAGIVENGQSYVLPLCSDGKLASIQTCPQKVREYKSQFIESDADRFAGEFVQALSVRLAQQRSVRPTPAPASP